jgi:hypothetical protein
VKHGFAKWRLEVPRHVLIEDVLIPLERASNDFDIRLLIGDVHTLPGAAGGTPPWREQCEARDRERTGEDAGRETRGARVPPPLPTRYRWP